MNWAAWLGGCRCFVSLDVLLLEKNAVFGCVAGWDTVVVAGGVFVFLRVMSL